MRRHGWVIAAVAALWVAAGNAQAQSTKNEPVEFGAVVVALTDQQRETQQLGRDEGVLVDRVRKWSPADAGGLKAGDIILMLGTQTVGSVERYAAVIKRYDPGETVEVLFKRDGKLETASIKMVKPELPTGAEGPLTDEERQQLKQMLGGALQGTSTLPGNNFDAMDPFGPALLRGYQDLKVLIKKAEERLKELGRGDIAEEMQKLCEEKGIEFNVVRHMIELVSTLRKPDAMVEWLRNSVEKDEEGQICVKEGATLPDGMKKGQMQKALNFMFWFDPNGELRLRAQCRNLLIDLITAVPVEALPSQRSLGVYFEAPAQEDLDKCGVKTGVKVIDVVPGRAADKAGIKPGELIVTWQGAGVKSIKDLRTKILQADFDKDIRVDVADPATGERRTVTVKLESAAEPAKTDGAKEEDPDDKS